MKFLTSLYITILFTGTIMAQGDPTVSSLMQYEQAPVDLSNGLQDVSVPVVTLPTRSKEMSCDVSFKYHPLNSIGGNQVRSNCGIGWNFFAGGLISRTIIANNDALAFYSNTPNAGDDIYQFNFMGYFGRFLIARKPDGTLGVKMIKQKESSLVLKIENDNHYEVTKFTFFDEKGYRYVFDVINNNNFYNSAYYLSSVIDNNNKELIHFTYQTLTLAPSIGPSGSIPGYIVNQITEIRSNGFGKVTVNYNGTGLNATISSLILSDSYGRGIKKIKLFGGITKIETTDMAETKKETYEFFYNNSSPNGNAIDPFGYKTNTPCQSSSPFGISNADGTKYGLLVKMTLPTGGTIIYDYESNTYSKYYKGSDNIWHYDLDPNSYYDLLNTSPSLPLITDNFIMTDYGTGATPYPFNFSNTASTFDFTITGTSPKTLFFNIYGEDYILPNLVHDTIGTVRNRTPTFTLQRISNYNYTVPHFGEQGYNIDTQSGYCFDQMIYLNPGNYRITISSDHNLYNVGTVEIKSQELNSNPTKWYYGGGVRLKQIGFFDGDAPFNFYDSFYNSIYISQGYKPVKEKKYNYNFFGESYSSGYLADSDFSTINQDDNDFGYSKMYFGGYKNVTVTDSQNNGREEYTFKDGLDPISTFTPIGSITFENSKRGLLLTRKTFDSNATLLSSVDFNYDFSDPETDGGVSTTYPFSTASYPPNYPTSTTPLLDLGKLTQKITKNYYGTQVKSVTEYFTYDLNNYLLTGHTTTNSLNETLKTEYVYDTNNSINSQNRIAELSQTKTYRAGSLLSTNKVNYSSNLFGNQSYLPQTIEYARSTANLEVKKRFNQYDDFSNLLEEQQENGIITSYIWGYNNTVIVAKLDNMSYYNIPNSLIVAIQSATDSTTATETDVINALNGLRASTNVNLQKAMITTYTYRPLIGISTVIDIKGDKMSYEYDELGKLIRARDKDNNILSETQYNLFNQN